MGTDVKVKGPTSGTIRKVERHRDPDRDLAATTQGHSPTSSRVAARTKEDIRLENSDQETRETKRSRAQLPALDSDSRRPTRSEGGHTSLRWRPE